MILPLIGMCALCNVSGDPWYFNWESNAITVPPVVCKQAAMWTIWMQSSNAIRMCTWFSTQRSGTAYYNWVNSPTMHYARSIWLLTHFGTTWDLCRGWQFVCWHWPWVLRHSQWSTWKQMNELNRWCHISTCWESAWRKCKQGWFYNLISVTTHTSWKWEIQCFSTPGSSWLAVKILQNQTWQTLIPESINHLCAGHFPLTKLLVPMLSGWTLWPTGKCPMIVKSPSWNGMVWLMAMSIVHHHHCR